MVDISLAYHINIDVMKKVIAVLLTENKNENTSVFTQSLKALLKDGYQIDIVTNEDLTGTFNSSDEVHIHAFQANHSTKALNQIFGFISIQIRLFKTVLKIGRPSNTIYISSIYPFAAAIAGKLIEAKVVYHLQEAALPKTLLQRFLHSIINRTAKQVIFTSAKLKNHLQLTTKKQAIVYPALSSDIIENAKHTLTQGQHPFTVSMIGDLGNQSGIGAFINLAECLPGINFELVATNQLENIERYVPGSTKPANLFVYTQQQNLHPFYQRASVVVNLSDNKKHLEVCDIHILQAMYYGKPVIVPANSSTREFINTQKNGVAIDSKHVEAIYDTLKILNQNKALYNSMSTACKQQAGLFSPGHFDKQITTLFKGSPRSVYSTLDQLFGASFFSSQVTPLKNQRAA